MLSSALNLRGKPSQTPCPQSPPSYYPLTHACTTGLQSAHSTRARHVGFVFAGLNTYVAAPLKRPLVSVSAQCQPRRRQTSTLSLLSLPPTAMHTQTGAPCPTHTTGHPVQHTCSAIDSTSCPSAHICLPRAAQYTRVLDILASTCPAPRHAQGDALVGGDRPAFCRRAACRVASGSLDAANPTDDVHVAH